MSFPIEGEVIVSCLVSPIRSQKPLNLQVRVAFWIDTLATVAAIAIDTIDGTQDPQYVIIPNFVHSTVDRVV